MTRLDEVTSNRVSLICLVDIPQMFPYAFSEGAKGFSNIEHATLSASDNIHYVGGGTFEMSLDAEGRLWTPDLYNVVQVGTGGTNRLATRVRAPLRWKVGPRSQLRVHQQVPYVGGVFEGHQRK